MHTSLGSKIIRYLWEEESPNHRSHSECDLLHGTTLCHEFELADNIDVWPWYDADNQQIYCFCIHDRAYAKVKLDSGDHSFHGD